MLNYYGDGRFETNSSMLWLAKTQKKEDALIDACEKAYKGNEHYIEKKS